MNLGNLSIDSLNKYKVVSFDIFDTLIKRDCYKPSHVFDMIQNCLGEHFSDFKEKRILAERNARSKSSEEEITIDDIYFELQEMSDSDVSYIKAIELEFEINLCERNKAIYTSYKELVKSKYVIITSDIYLPQKIVEKILNNAGIDEYKGIYLSSEYKLTKNTGNLFKKVVSDLRRKKIISKTSEIVHIGDNKKSDYVVPKSLGMSAIHIPIWNPSSYFKTPKIELSKKEKNIYFDLVSFISNKEADDYSFFQKMGYEALGPILFGFINWVLSITLEYKLNKAFFLSRDGQIMKKVWDKIDASIYSEYIYGSRRAYIVPTLWMCESFEEMISSMFIPRIINIGAILKKLGLDPARYEKEISKFNLQLDTFFSYDELLTSKDFRRFIEIIYDDIIINSKEEYEVLVDYLRKVNFSGNIALIDIGWHANMQKALIKICKRAGIDVHIHGLYVGINPEVFDLNNDWRNLDDRPLAKGFLFDRKKNENLFYYEKNFTSIFETLFCADHGSVIKFNEMLNPVLLPFEYCGSKEADESYNRIKEIQDAALDYVEDAIEKSKYFVIDDSNVVSNNIMSLGNYPNKEIATKFGDFMHYDDEPLFIAKSRGLAYYFTHINEFKKDYNNACWKIGFFYRIFNIHIPYYKLRMLRVCFQKHKPRKKMRKYAVS